MSRRRIRLREITRRYLMPTTEAAGDTYVPPPPDPEDGPLRFGVTIPEDRRFPWPLGPMTTAGEAMAVYCDDHDDRLALWRHRHPESAAVVDGVTVTEAGVVPLDQPYRLEGEDGGR
ncbi:hypothetical protein [Dietzia cinnamea]|uniref:hypothetical protein n=1 Tax=Dietzia cinnamea TaxID=321318 RepID=UPI0021A73E40|nr:hypothetical protein [Dietzia cinnamea]MCT1639738.1 hypothetical protein [Dietzia cinnamea]